MDESTESLRDAYKSLNYRLQTTEPLFIHDLKKIPRVKSPAIIVRVLTGELAEKLGEAQNMKPMKANELAKDAPIRQYAAVVDDQIVGWVSSISVGKRTWVSNLVVKHAFRRRGIGKALMAKMLRDDRAAGSIASALLASHAGAMLYPLVGYRQIGEMLVLNPPRRKRNG
jgi:GNAT superfamily N-acetyltransferase